MDDYALVLNAGSSSLKFCVYRRPDAEKWRLEVARPDRGHRHVAAILRQGRSRRNPRDRTIWMTGCRDGRAALDALAAWLRSKYGGARVLGVGHRVVHGGARYAQPTIVTPASSGRAARTGSAGSAASAAQPGGHRSGLRANARRAAGGLFRHELSSGAARRSRSWYRCRGRSAKRACSDMAFTACRTNTSRRFCPRWLRRSPGGASSSRILEAVPVCAP